MTAQTTTRTRKATTTKRRRPAPAAQPVAEVEIPKVRPVEGYTVDLQADGEDTSRTWEKLLAKDPNGTHQEFCDWFEENTGERPDVKTVQWVLATYQEFQRSPEHKAKTQAAREEAAKKRATAAAAKVKRAAEAARKAGLKIVEA